MSEVPLYPTKQERLARHSGPSRETGETDMNSDFNENVQIMKSAFQNILTHDLY